MTSAMTITKQDQDQDHVPPVLDAFAVQLAIKEGINLLYYFNPDYPRDGGYTIAYRESRGYIGRKPGKMVDVAVAYCSEGDTFSKKIGRELAILNFQNHMYVQVPAMMYGKEQLHHCLREMFSWHDEVEYVL